jgi:hypothetical protein
MGHFTRNLSPFSNKNRHVIKNSWEELAAFNASREADANMPTQTKMFGITNILNQRLPAQAIGEDTERQKVDESDLMGGGEKEKTQFKKHYQSKKYTKDDMNQLDSKTTDQPHHKKPRHKDFGMSSVKDITTSEWVLVHNAPPMSQLSDLLPSLSNILEYEINKGVIDLDELLKGRNFTFKHPKYYQRLKKLDALRSLYSKGNLTEESGLPLWKFNIDPDQSLPAQLIKEVRLHLSYRARPMGWFLRFANRSIAHAVRCHVANAQVHETMLCEQFEEEQQTVRRERKMWMDGLWKRVYDDYARENSLGLEKGVEEQELMDVVDDHELDGSDNGSLGCSGNDSNQLDEGLDIDGEKDKPKHDVNEFFDEYSQSHPYPMHSTSMPMVESVFRLHHLKCGSIPLQVSEFMPTTSPIAKGNIHSTWEQHSFHLGNLLDLSDSVVRVETSAVKTTVNDIKYLFRAYDLESIYPEPIAKEMLPASFVDLPQSIGWNLRRYESFDETTPLHLPIDMLVQAPEKKGFGKRDEKKKIDPPVNHMFLVRFATPVEARMAIREKQGSVVHGAPLMMTQYPKAEM